MLELERYSSSHYDALMAYIERINQLNGGTAFALFVIHNDQVVAEYYGGEHSGRRAAADSQFNVASVRKSYIGFAAAWALTIGAIRSFDDPVLRYVRANGDNAEVLSGVTIRHLLTHTHGLGRVNDQSIWWSCVWLIESAIIAMNGAAISTT
ncbi:serine hydrolase [Paenibacillus kobensis]|uniref:serine hydrolase n=1 Tax=Paenibacillus kobensis TaxID=59841 RepID=UPI001FE59D8A|nr:serine hydrolase domain-containing protein [Paenibacillus kobensis]